MRRSNEVPTRLRSLMADNSGATPSWTDVKPHIKVVEAILDIAPVPMTFTE